jgi:hypothetical protein
MKQQDAYKIIAALMILIMIGAPLYLLAEGPNSGTTQETQTPDTNLKKYNPDLWMVNEPFYSISDALSMTPVGTVSANFVDLENMPPQMIQWVRQSDQLIPQVDSLYKSNTTKVFYARLHEGENQSENNSFLLLSTMSTPKNDFEYMVEPGTNILIRQEKEYNGMYNILGTPIIYAPPQTAVNVLEIIYGKNKTNTSYDQYEGLLSKVEPVSYQIVSSNVTFAQQFYMGIGLKNGSFEKTTAYLNANSSVLAKLNQSRANSTERGFEQYIVNQSGNYTTVKIVSQELLIVLSEETS